MDRIEAQATLVAALADPAVYGHPVERVERIETHISWVLLAGEYVYKIKKPLDLGFLDFTELERRRFYCEEEVRLNRRTAPDLYLGVVAITGTADRPEIDGSGEPIEYAVRMRRFDVEQGFDRLLARGALETAHIIDLAGQLAELHAVAAVAGPDSGQGSFDDVAEPVRDNFDVLSGTADSGQSRRLEKLRAWSEDQLRALDVLIERRRRAGCVRECHGDAHLGNVALHRGRAMLFDCIEFSPALRWIDVINDLAFAVMDLRDRGAEPLAWTLLDEYLARSGDFDGLRLLPFYAVYRAMVRAKVQGFARDQAGDDAARAGLDEEIADYLRLGERMADERRAAVIITIGLSGSGKSWLARRLVDRVGLVRVRSDVERKRLYGLPAGARSGSGLNAQLYSTGASERTYARLVEAAEAICAAGYPALIDAAFLKRWQRDRLRRMAAAHGLPFRIIHCTAPEATLAERIQAREAQGTDASEAGLDVLELQRQSAEPLSAAERARTIVVDTREAGAVERVAAALDL
ncbi:MAG: AAA family ATPase [Wenzhouxiangella sp.]|jgi:aminoglycoside phosphotransferase family enzyme/predicted kinase|nr:AAA family ATPase [Wenzhouxiangella sp.]